VVRARGFCSDDQVVRIHFITERFGGWRREDGGWRREDGGGRMEEGGGRREEGRRAPWVFEYPVPGSLRSHPDEYLGQMLTGKEIFYANDLIITSVIHACSKFRCRGVIITNTHRD
jgi:hypothetical protein